MSTPFNVKMQKPFFFKYSQAYEGGSGWRDRTNPGCFGWGWMHGVLWVDKHNLFLSAGWCLWASLYPLSVLKDREPCANAATNHVSSRCKPTPLVGSSSFKSVVFVYALWKNSNVCCLWKMWIARSLIHTVCEWKRVCVCGGAVQFALAGFQRLPPALPHRKKRWRSSGFCTSSPASTTAGLRRWCCRWSALVKVALSPSRRSARRPWTSVHLSSCRRARGDGFFHTQTGNLHPQRRQQWRATGEGLTQTWEEFDAGQHLNCWRCFHPSVQKMLDYLKDKKDVGFFLSIQSLMQTCRSVASPTFYWCLAPLTLWEDY